MSRYRRMRRGRVTQVQGIASRGEDFFLMNITTLERSLEIAANSYHKTLSAANKRRQL